MWTLLTDAMLPPVDTLTVLHSLIPKGSLWLCVHVPQRSFLNCFSREWNPFQPLHVDFPAALNISTCEWQSGTIEAFCLLYI